MGTDIDLRKYSWKLWRYNEDSRCKLYVFSLSLFFFGSTVFEMFVVFFLLFWRGRFLNICIPITSLVILTKPSVQFSFRHLACIKTAHADEKHFLHSFLSLNSFFSEPFVKSAFINICCQQVEVSLPVLVG